MKFILKSFLIWSLFVSAGYSQTLINTYPFPSDPQYNSFWGITELNDTLFVATDNSGAIYKVSKTGTVHGIAVTPPPTINFNHGLDWDGSGFWVARAAGGTTRRFYKIDLSGAVVDSITIPSIGGSSTIGLGGIDIRGNDMWFCVYFPDYTVYPYSYAYKIDLTTKAITDTIPLRGKQPQGITVKGDTIFYVNDNFQSEPERIYAYSISLGDTIFSFPAPDPDGSCDPRGLHWDGEYLWHIAQGVGAVTSRTLYKYELGGSGNAIISVSADSLSYGNVVIGQSSNLPLTITNNGNAPLIITNFNMSNPAFTINPNSLPDTIAPSSNAAYTVTFSPTAFGNTPGTLQISSNDVGQPVETIGLRGVGVNAGGHISTVSSYDYSSRRVNSLCGYIFEIENQGVSALQINSISTGTARFYFDTVGVNFPVSINPLEKASFRIWFNPNAVGAFSDVVTIQSNASNTPTYTFNISGTGNAAVTQLGDIMWQGINPANPNTSFNDIQPMSMKKISDVNGDGVDDILVSTENYHTICYNGNSSVTADILWIYNTHFGTINTGSVDWQDAMQTIPDIDGDGIMDVIIGCAGGNEMVYAISGRSGQKIWEYGNPSTTDDGDIMGIRTDRDYNNDGKMDVLISASGTQNGGRHAAICVNGLNGTEIFNVTQTAGFTYDIVATDFGGAISLGNDGPPYLVNGFNSSGVSAWSYPVLGAVWCMRQVPDLNNDGIKDVMGYYTQSFGSGFLFAVTGDAGAELWTKDLGQGNNGNMAFFPDLDGNGFDEVISSGPQTIHRIDIKTDSVQWSYSPSASYSRGIDNIGDVNGDSIADVAVIMQNPPKVIVLDGSKGAVLFEYSLGAGINQRGDRIASLGDVDDNNSNEFVAGSRDGKVICFSGGPDGTVGIQTISNVIPDKFSLQQNYPNPFNPTTKIKFDIPQNAKVSLKVYDVLGREVANLVNSQLIAGVYEYTFEGSAFSSGIYFYTLETENFKETKKMLLVK
ncbi:MAG TPA: choice-of-anchor D domain-containing protein [Ignavibacteria bacterium]|nr:choice-of-anchor D domain-containing protein [Ignavibacteria bacterium]